jgi:beta-lactam-binding protein with PASTA domain
VFKFITDKPLWVNILTGIGLILMLILLFFGSLDWITGYGKFEKVPNVAGQHIIAAQKMLEDQGFEVVIQDSVYIDTIAKQAVIRQSPEADAVVKTGRAVYLTLNRTIPPQVEMPNLTGFSIRSAEMYLQSLGLKLGFVTYKPDIARNAVLEQLLNGNSVKPGEKIAIGSVINLVLGSGVGGDEIDMPELVGLTLDQARSTLSSLNINIGSIIAAGNIKDSAAAFITKQSPSVWSDIPANDGSATKNKIRQGQIIDLFISEQAPVKDTTIHHPF